MKGVFSYVRYESGDVYIVNLLMKNIGIFVVFIATVFLSTKSIWAKLIYLDSLSPLSVLAYRALLSLPFFILPMIHYLHFLSMYFYYHQIYPELRFQRLC